jgi:hypothetical protein
MTPHHNTPGYQPVQQRLLNSATYRDLVRGVKTAYKLLRMRVVGPDRMSCHTKADLSRDFATRHVPDGYITCKSYSREDFLPPREALVDMPAGFRFSLFRAV